MKRLILLTAALLAIPAARAQITSPELSGLHRLTLLGNSDSVICATFARPAVAGGLAQSFSGSQVTFRGTPGWTPNQFVAGGPVADTFCLRVASGAKEGAFYTITANTANFVTVNLEGDTLTGLTAGDRLAILPYSTLATLFPGGTGVHPSPTLGERQSEILFPNYNATGINAAPNRKFHFWDGHWREVGIETEVRDSEIVYPDSYFIVRHNVVTATQWVCTGQVISGKLSAFLGVNSSGKRDNDLGLLRPTDFTLGVSGLISSGGFAVSPSPGVRTDELLIFDNSIPGQNRAATDIYFYWNNAWRKVGAGTVTFDHTPVLKAGTGFLIRKNAAATAPIWTNLPNY